MVEYRIPMVKYVAHLIDGFFAAGESACVSVHGANRLGSNSCWSVLFMDVKLGFT